MNKRRRKFMKERKTSELEGKGNQNKKVESDEK